MKSAFIILALVAVAGCGSMMPSSSSGSMESSTGSSGYPSGYSPERQIAEAVAPSMVLP